MASKTREAIFATFGEANLPSINSNASSKEITRWKRKPEVSKCYKFLFEKIDTRENSELAITYIIKKVLNKKSSKVEMAFVIAICVSIFNPKDGKFRLTTKIMKCKVNYYLVSFCT